MVGYKDTSNVAKKAAEVSQKKNNNKLLVSFVYSWNEIATWMGHSFNTKSKNNIFFEFEAADH